MTNNDCTRLFPDQLILTVKLGFFWKILCVVITLAPSIPSFENGHFAFTSAQKTTNVFLVSEQHHQCHRNGKNPVKRIINIKYHKYKNRKCNTGQY